MGRKNGCEKYFPVIRTIYATYKGMMYRCYDKNNPAYKYYGGRGVEVCDEWKNSYQSFLDWALLNGWNEGLELDKDILGNGLLYSPKTCKWVTHTENMKNLSRFKKYEHNGEMLTMSKISELTGIPKSAIYSRMKHGATIQQAISKGVVSGKSANTRFYEFNGEVLSLRSICLKNELSYSYIKYKVNERGLSISDAINAHRLKFNTK